MANWKRNTTLPDRIDDPVLGTIRFAYALDGMDEYQAQQRHGPHNSGPSF
jgi:hypothetical protein